MQNCAACGAGFGPEEKVVEVARQLFHQDAVACSKAQDLITYVKSRLETRAKLRKIQDVDM